MQRRTVLLVAGSLAVLVTAVVVLLRSSEPDDPREVVETYLDESFVGDASEAWDLTCQRDQEEQGPRDRYLREAAAEQEEMAAAGDEYAHVTIGYVRYDEEARAHAVELVFRWPDGSGFADEVFVIEESGGLKVCSPE